MALSRTHLKTNSSTKSWQAHSFSVLKKILVLMMHLTVWVCAALQFGRSPPWTAKLGKNIDRTAWRANSAVCTCTAECFFHCSFLLPLSAKVLDLSDNSFWKMFMFKENVAADKLENSMQYHKSCLACYLEWPIATQTNRSLTNKNHNFPRAHGPFRGQCAMWPVIKIFRNVTLLWCHTFIHPCLQRSLQNGRPALHKTSTTNRRSQVEYKYRGKTCLPGPYRTWPSKGRNRNIPYTYQVSVSGTEFLRRSSSGLGNAHPAFSATLQVSWTLK